MRPLAIPTLGVAGGALAFSADALVRNGFDTSISIDDAHVPMRRSIPAAALGAAAGAAIGAWVSEGDARVERTDALWSGGLAAVGVVSATCLGIACAIGARGVYRPAAEFAGMAVPGIGIAAGAYGAALVAIRD